MASQPPDGPSGSAAPAGSKAIASLAKKQNDVTRQGTQKMKFTPLKRKKTELTEVKSEQSVNVSTPTETTRGRGRGRGEGRSRGEARGRGRGAPRPPVEMTASGPFAMGPTMAGSGGMRRTTQFQTPVAVPTSTNRSSALGAGLSRTTAPSLKREPEDPSLKKEEDEVYSEPDEGVEIIDLDNVHQMDWMAPESLRRLKNATKKKKRVKQEEDSKGKGKATENEEDMDVDTPAVGAEVDLANALDLSESEEEEEMEDLVEDFARATTADEAPDLRQDRLLWFQFPSPFPTFISPKNNEPSRSEVTEAPTTQGSSKKVAFAPDTKPPAPSAKPSREPTAPPENTKADADPRVDGIIGQLEVYQSGAVKIRLGNGILLDVASAIQPSFLQHAVYIDEDSKRMCVLGEVNKRFIVSPNVDMLLNALQSSEKEPAFDGEQDLITMDDIA